MKNVSKMYHKSFVYETEFSKSITLGCEYLNLFDRTEKVKVSVLASKYFGYALAIAYLSYLDGILTQDEYSNIDVSINHTIDRMKYISVL